MCIGPSEVPLSELRIPWLREQIGRRKDDDHPVCVRIKVSEADVDMVFPCGACGGGGGGGRRLTPREEALAKRWRSLGLNTPDFPFGQLVAFLNGLR